MSIKQSILQFLQQSASSVTALQVAKGIGLSRAKDVNPTLYALEKEGQVERNVCGNKVTRQGMSERNASRRFTEPFQHSSLNTKESGFQTESSDSEPSMKCFRSERGTAQLYSDDDVEMQAIQEEEDPKKHFDIDKYHRKRSLNEGEKHLEMSEEMPHHKAVPHIPKAPHEILKPVGPRTAVLADALYGKHDYGNDTVGQTPQGIRPQPSGQFSLVQSQSTTHGASSASYGEYARMQATEHPSSDNQQLMHMSHGYIHDNANEMDGKMVDKILKFLEGFNRPVATLEIAKAVNRKTKREVNPTLYDLEKKGVIVKTSNRPPAWRLASSALSNPASSPAYSIQPGRSNQQDDVLDSQRDIRTQFRQLDRARQLSWPEGETTIAGERKQAYDNMMQQSNLSSPPVASQNQNQVPRELSSITFAALNKNPVSAINEYAQKNQMALSFELLHEAQGGPNRFLMAVKLNERMYNAVAAGNMKDARKEAADVALREILSSQEASSSTSLQLMTENKQLTHFDQIAMLSHQAFLSISAEVQDKFAGRKVIAAIVKKTYGDEIGEVVSVGSGNRCITGDRLTLDGKTVNDSHAEIICRRAFLHYIYSELDRFYSKQESIFTTGGVKGRLQIKDNITWHLYISTAPCGDGALFTPRDNTQIDPSNVDAASREHVPLYTSKPQGLLRTKVEDGEGTIPIDPNDGPQTWDGIARGNRLRTMSCTDKICKWNVLGMQGALLSHIIEPIYLESLTLGYLYEHGHLARGVCCRLSKDSDINEKLPMPYSLNHPWLGRVTAHIPSRETQKTNNLSVNWYFGSSGVELTDGRTGCCLTRNGSAPTPSRLCKAELYKRFKMICSRNTGLQQLASFETYREAKEKALEFQEAKAVMNKQLKNSKFGAWVKKPRELELFDV